MWVGTKQSLEMTHGDYSDNQKSEGRRWLESYTISYTFIQLILGSNKWGLENRIAREQVRECSKLDSQSGIEQRRAE